MNDNVIPGIDTPGFKLASPRTFQVWLALFDHAQNSGYGVWTVDLLAKACGCTRNTVSAALTELVELGWIRKSIERHAGGEYLGFRFELQVPPKVLHFVAQRRYQRRVDQAERHARALQTRLEPVNGRRANTVDGEVFQ